MKKEMYNDDNRYNEDALIIDEQTNTALKTIFDFWIKEGYGPREISHVMMETVHEIELESVLFNDKE
jgi:hypothetical protein